MQQKLNMLLKTAFLLFLTAGNDLYASASNSSSRDLEDDNLQEFSGRTVRISTANQHTDYLKKAISGASSKILITSHGINPDVFEEHDLYTLFTNARARNVAIYVYNIDNKPTDSHLLSFFKKIGIKYDETFTHAKILAVDKKEVAIGSYSWLEGQGDWDNATFCLTGGQCKHLTDLLWTDLKFYRNKQFGNKREVDEYLRNPENHLTSRWRLPGASMSYLHSLDAHRDFIEEAFEKASKRIIFFSPFIQSRSGYKEDFSAERVMGTITRGVHVYFVYRKKDKKMSDFQRYLGDLLKSPHLHFLIMPDFHQKTVIVDDSLIAEGSFNWLSAARDEESKYHNHEVTLVLEGSRAKDALRDFHESAIGQDFAEARWMLQPWSVSTKGNPYIHATVDDMDETLHHVVIAKGRGASYSAMIDNAPLRAWYFFEHDAKIAALRALQPKGRP